MLKGIIEKELNEFSPKERETLKQFGKLPMAKRVRTIGLFLVLLPLILLFAITLPLVLPLLKRLLKRLPPAPQNLV